MKLTFTLSVVGLAFILLIGGRLIYGTHEWGERLTLHFQTPSGPVVASGVFGRRHWMHWIPMGNERSVETNGEAITVEFDTGQTVFALVDNAKDTISYRAYEDLYPSFGGLGSISMGVYLHRISKQIGAPARAIDPKYFPLLFAFEDISDPRSGYLVSRNDIFGEEAPGYALESVKIEITDDEPADGNIERTLPWLRGWEGHIRPDAVSAPEYLNPIDKAQPIQAWHFSRSFAQ